MLTWLFVCFMDKKWDTTTVIHPHQSVWSEQNWIWKMKNKMLQFIIIWMIALNFALINVIDHTFMTHSLLSSTNGIEQNKRSDHLIVIKFISIDILFLLQNFTSQTHQNILWLEMTTPHFKRTYPLILRAHIKNTKKNTANKRDVQVSNISSIIVCFVT